MAFMSEKKSKDIIWFQFYFCHKKKYYENQYSTKIEKTSFNQNKFNPIECSKY